MEVTSISSFNQESVNSTPIKKDFLEVVALLIKKEYLNICDVDNFSLVNKKINQWSQHQSINPPHDRLSTTAEILAFKAAQCFMSDIEDNREKVILGLHESEVALYAQSYFKNCSKLSQVLRNIQNLADNDDDLTYNDEELAESIVKNMYHLYKDNNKIEHIINLSHSFLIEEGSALQKKISKYINEKLTLKGVEIFKSSPVQIKQITKNIAGLVEPEELSKSSQLLALKASHYMFRGNGEKALNVFLKIDENEICHFMESFFVNYFTLMEGLEEMREKIVHGSETTFFKPDTVSKKLASMITDLYIINGYDGHLARLAKLADDKD